MIDKIRSVVLVTLLSLLMTFGLSAQALVAVDSKVTVEYEHRVTDAPNSIHIAEFVPGQGRIVMVKAREYSLGKETVSAISTRENAVFGINASFFEMRGELAGIPVGMLKIRDDWYGIPRFPRAVLGWTEDGSECLIDQVQMLWKVRFENREEILSTINAARKADALLLFTPAFNTSTLTGAGGLEIIVEDGRVTGSHSNGNAAIPKNGFVLSYGEDAAKGAVIPEPGTPVEIHYVFQPRHPEKAGDEDWKKMEHIVGGAGLLIWNGEPVGDYLVEELDKQGNAFDTTRHPRTAIGIDAQGKWIFVVVDGRQPGKSVGMSLSEMTELMSSLGCQYALNLDGGGSSTMYLNGKVVNSPSNRPGMMMGPAPGMRKPAPGMRRPGAGMQRPGTDGPSVERPVSDALLILE